MTDPAVARARADAYGLPDEPFFLMVVKGYARIEYDGAAPLPAKERGRDPRGVRPRPGGERARPRAWSSWARACGSG